MLVRTLFTCALAVGCAPLVEDLPSEETESEPASVALDEDLADTAGPRSQAVIETAHAPPTRATQLRDRMSLMRPEERVVLAGTVNALRAERRRLTPNASSITTRATIAIGERYCGDAGALTEVLYEGGRVGDHAEYSSSIARDLEIGRSYVFVLRRRGGELVLEMGTQDLVRPGAITTLALKESCQ